TISKETPSPRKHNLQGNTILKKYAGIAACVFLYFAMCDSTSSSTRLLGCHNLTTGGRDHRRPGGHVDVVVDGPNAAVAKHGIANSAGMHWIDVIYALLLAGAISRRRLVVLASNTIE